MAAIRVRLGRDDNQKPAGRRVKTAVANALRRFAPVETGRLRRSIRVVSYGVLIAARYASFTNTRGRSAGWVESAIASPGAERGALPGCSRSGPDAAGVRPAPNGPGTGGAGSGAGPEAEAAAKPRDLDDPVGERGSVRSQPIPQRIRPVVRPDLERLVLANVGGLRIPRIGAEIVPQPWARAPEDPDMAV